LEETKGPHKVTTDETFGEGHEPVGEILRLFQYKIPRIGVSKSKPGIFAGPQRKELMNNINYNDVRFITVPLRRCNNLNI
jgi:hypothetical protein